MKKIGFIDYFIDEWHANNYPRLIRESPFGNEFKVALAWALIDPPGKKPLDAWCLEHGIGKARSIEDVVENCDCLVVLSPDNVEQHESLAALPLRSGKPVYIDKPFAPDLKTAQSFFDRARTHKTPLMSSSALRFAPELRRVLAEKIAGRPVHFMATGGPGVFHVYAIHQLEMLAMTLGVGANRVMHIGNDYSDVMAVHYPDGRRGVINLAPGYEFGFLAAYGEREYAGSERLEGFFEEFVKAMLLFFKTGESPVEEAQTLEIIALLEAGMSARKKQDEWFYVPR